ncbi:bzip transcription factor [Apiospora arundinis]|uniref:Bzip transcription factor n=1 Tax=Apiospora arundinis TaxID=335852 RepID=A0ABR2IWY2_9PEZI
MIMGICQQISDDLAYELSQSPMGTSCDFLLDPCITSFYQNDPQQFFNFSTEQQDTAIKPEDIGDPQPWESFSSTSKSGTGETLEPVAPSPVRRSSSTAQSVSKKPRRNRGRSGSSGGPTGISREKNRIAASKCRRKKKDEEHILEGRRRMLYAQNSILINSATSLRAEVLSLKHEILRHGTCDFQPINSYIATAATRVG